MADVSVMRVGQVTVGKNMLENKQSTKLQVSICTSDFSILMFKFPSMLPIFFSLVIIVNDLSSDRGLIKSLYICVWFSVYTAYYNTSISKFHKYTFKISTVKNQVVTLLSSIIIVYVETDITSLPPTKEVRDCAKNE